MFQMGLFISFASTKAELRQIITLYKIKDELRFDDIQFPVNIEDIDKFEELNDIAIWVYLWDEGLRPIRVYLYQNRTTIIIKLEEVPHIFQPRIQLNVSEQLLM